MNGSVHTITIPGLLLSLLPLVAVAWVFYRWQGGVRLLGYASLRMVLQLLLVGYFLIYLFRYESAWTLVATVPVVMGFASWIALRPFRHHDRRTFLRIFGALALSGLCVLSLDLWIIHGWQAFAEPRIFVPLSGMIFANSMNAISLAGERFERERMHGGAYLAARNTAFNAAMIPQVNSFFAVGIVSLPGMMTGQILAGVSPLEAVRYQILVMSMVLGGAGVAVALFLHWQRSAEPLATNPTAAV